MTEDEKKWVEEVRDEERGFRLAIQKHPAGFNYHLSVKLLKSLAVCTDIIERQEQEISGLQNALLDKITEESQKMGLYDEEKPNDQ